MTGLRGSFQIGVVVMSACLLFTLMICPPLSAQNDLSRISAVERSDGMGIVIRYHLSETADSFRVRQPEPDLIQIKLWDGKIDTSGLRMPPEGNTLGDIELHAIDRGFGSDIHLQPETSYLADAYVDQNGRDLLIALTRSEREDVLSITERVKPVHWPSYGATSRQEALILDPEIALSAPLERQTGGGLNDTGYDDELYIRMRENTNFDTVVIDAGHGGRDPGTIGHGGIFEKDVTLAVAKKLGGYIREHMPEVDVVYTREDDNFIELSERGRIANQAQGDLFVSIHANSYPRNPNVKGAEVYFLGLARSQSALEVMKRENSVLRLENGDDGIDELTEEDLIIYELANAGNLTISERIAEKVEHQFRERAQRNSRGVKQAQFVVLYHASMPALLVELGFITNPDEARYLTSDYGQSIVASALFRAIRDYKEEFERSRNITRSSE